MRRIKDEMEASIASLCQATALEAGFITEAYLPANVKVWSRSVH